MHVIARSLSTSSLTLCPPPGPADKCRSLPDMQLVRALSSIGNTPGPASRLSLHSSLADEDCAVLDLGSAASLVPGDLRKDTPSPDTLQHLDDCRALLTLPRQCGLGTDGTGRIGPVTEGSAEQLLMRAHGLDAGAASRTAHALRRGGFHPPGERVTTVGDVADAMSRLGERTCYRALPAEVCAATEAALTASMTQQNENSDPWHQFGLDLARNPYVLDGTPETALHTFKQATDPLPPLQQRLVHELHQGLLAPLEACIFFGNVLHRGGALLRGEDGSDIAAPRANTRFQLAIDRRRQHDARALLLVHHDRPLSSALPRTAGLDALPEQRTLTRDSAYHVSLRARCSPDGTVTVTGEHAVRLRYPAPAAAEPAELPAALQSCAIDAHVHGRLTAGVMDLHAQAMSGRPHAVALHLAAVAPETGSHRIADLLALARTLDAQTGQLALLSPELARFAFAELRRCADTARLNHDHGGLALIRQALFTAGENAGSPLQSLPAFGHWQHARQELCGLLVALFYRSANQSAVPALDVPPTRRERQERDRQLGQLQQTAKALRWAELGALLPAERFGMWRTTRVQRPAACAYQHDDAARYLEIALGCLNVLAERVAPVS